MQRSILSLLLLVLLLCLILPRSKEPWAPQSPPRNGIFTERNTLLSTYIVSREREGAFETSACFLACSNPLIISSFFRKGYLQHVKKYYNTEPVQNAAVVDPNDPSFDSATDLSNKTIIISGANSGIGYELSMYVASKNAKLYMLCRSPERAEQSKQEIMDKTQNHNIHILLGDISELAQVRRVVQEFQQQESKLDCLVCNAGVLLNERKENSEGNEVTFASHLLGGSYLLSELLYPQLKNSEQSRVIYVSSGGMLRFKFPEWDVVTSSTDKQKENYNGADIYSYAKRGQVLLANEFSKDPNHAGVTYVSCHPGWTRTAAVQDAFGDQAKYLEPMREPWQGAEGIAWLASTDRKNLVNGAFYLDRKVQKQHISGPFMTEGSFTKNSEEEIKSMMEHLKKAAGL